MPVPVNSPPLTGVKTSYALPSASDSELGMVPDGSIGSGACTASAGARETRTVKVAMHGARSASVIPKFELWWLRHMPSGPAAAVTVYVPGSPGAV